MPATLAAGVLGVVGLTSTVRLTGRSSPHRRHRAAARAPAAKPDCELPYPTRKQLITIAQTGVHAAVRLRRGRVAAA